MTRRCAARSWRSSGRTPAGCSSGWRKFDDPRREKRPGSGGTGRPSGSSGCGWTSWPRWRPEAMHTTQRYSAMPGGGGGRSGTAPARWSASKKQGRLTKPSARRAPVSAKRSPLRSSSLTMRPSSTSCTGDTSAETNGNGSPTGSISLSAGCSGCTKAVQHLDTVA